MGAGTPIRGATDNPAGELGSSGEHVPEAAATESCPAGCEAGGWAQVISSLVFHHIHWRENGEESENDLVSAEGLCSLLLLPTTSSSPSLKGTAFFLLGMNARTLQNDPKSRH